MSDLLSPGELLLSDKLQSAEYLQGRTGALQRLHRLDPRLAAEVISYAWPHPAGRSWTDDELYERLGTPKPRTRKQGSLAAFLHVVGETPTLFRAAKERRDRAKRREAREKERQDATKVAARYLGKFASTFVDTYMPSVGAAFDAFQMERARQEALEASKYPALHFTQPMMASYAMGGGAAAPAMTSSHHHRRHKHGEEKTALPRWQREEPSLTPDEVRARRTAYWSQAPELSQEALTRHRELRQRQVDAISKREGVRPGDSPLAQFAGAHMMGDVVQLPPNQGHALRQAVAATTAKVTPPQLRDLLTVEGRKAYGDRMIAAMSSSMTVPERQPYDPTVQHAVLHHELGERAQARAAKTREVGSRFVASHLGETPDIAERHSLFRDPEAGALFDSLRQSNKGDAFVQAKMRQFGHTPNNPMPLGGRAHRALAHAVLEQAPVEGPARINRIAGTTPLLGQGLSAVMKRNPLLKDQHVEIYPAALPSHLRSSLLQAEGVASQVGRSLAKIPGVQGLYERFKAPVKSLFEAAHTSPGTARSFLKHLSVVR